MRIIWLWVGCLLVSCFSESGPQGGSGTDGGCEPGVIRVCTCDDGAQGQQVCEPDGDGYGSCECTLQTGTGSTTTGAGETTTDATGGSSDSTGGAICKHRVFVTDATYRGGDILSAENGDALCQLEADAAGLGGSWTAVLGGAQPANERVVLCGPVYLVEDESERPYAELIAEAGDFWADEHVNSIDRSPTGASIAAQVWTGADASGGSALDCDHWSSTDVSVRGQWGWTGMVAGSWVAEDLDTCDASKRIYCIEAPPG